MKVSAMCLNIVAKPSALIAGSAFAPQVVQELSDKASWKVEGVPCRIDLTVS